MGAIFISYRRDDADGHARLLLQNLRDVFGKESVFMDVVGIEPGVDFRKTIDAKLNTCSVLLALMGRQWLDQKNAAGTRRLDDDNDFVRLETAAALRRDIHVIPVLVQGARMPVAEALPPDLKDLSFRNGVELTHARWDSDVQLLVQSVAKLVPAQTPQAAAVTPDPTQAYRDKAMLALADGVIMPPERIALEEARTRLGLSVDQAQAIELALLDGQRRLAQYRQEFAATLASEYPLSDATRADLQQRAAALDLAPDEVAQIDQEMLAEAEAGHQQQREHLARQARQAETAARQATTAAPSPPPAVAAAAAAPRPAPAPAPAAAAAPIHAAAAAAADDSTDKPTKARRMQMAAIGAVVTGVCVLLSFAAANTTNDPVEFTLGAAFWGGVAGAASNSHGWIWAVAVLMVGANLIG